MEPNDFLHLLKNCDCLVGNSSVGIRECSFIGVPTVNIGTRQNRRQRGKNVIDAEYDKESIKAAIQERIDKKGILSEHIYGNGNSGKQIAEALANTELIAHKTIMY